MAFEGMSPFSMMGMNFGEQEEDPETEAFMEFLTKNVQYMKSKLSLIIKMLFKWKIQ